MLNQKQSEFYKKMLNQRLDAIRQELAQAVAQSEKEEDETYADWTDVASVESNRAVEMMIKDREKKLAGEIFAALQRIEANTFGECVSCGDEIAESRLQARPTTTLCIDCMSEREASTGRLR